MKTLLAGLLAAGLAAAAVHAQSSAWKVPRTPDGKPDFQGVWSNNSVTPMTRPPQWRDKERLTDAEVEELKTLVARYTVRAATRSSRAWSRSPSAEGEPQVLPALLRRPTGNYNQFWMSDRDWDNRTSLITDPPNGQFPA